MLQLTLDPSCRDALDARGFKPMFVRVIGLNPDPKAVPFHLAIEHPDAVPGFLLSFIIDNFAVFGWYFSDSDGFAWTGEDGKMLFAASGDAYHEAAMLTIMHFRDTLDSGGSETQIDYPSGVKYAERD